MGDGGLTKNQIIVTVHSIDDKKYSDFIVSLIKKLFDVHVGLHYRKNSLGLSCIVSRSGLVKYLVEKVGLEMGNKVKNQVDIPNRIKKNKHYNLACVRGLIDTDGCIFTHKYKVDEKQYSYKKMAFRSYSNPLILSVFKILKDCGLDPRIAKENDLRLDRVEDVKKYIEIIGSNNPKHLKRYKS